MRCRAITKETFQEYYDADKIIFPGDYDFLKISKPVMRYWKDDDIKKAGADFGIVAVSTNLPAMLILPENKFAALIDERYSAEFEEKIFALPEIETVFIVTDSSDGYTAMIQNLRNRKTFQLYMDKFHNQLLK